MNEATFGLRQWLARLNQAELPAMAVVVHDLLRLSQSENASVRQLTEVLLRDTSLTSRVLRVSNSVYCNPGREVVKTISRAVVVIGFDQVRMIGLSVSLLDGLLQGAPREQLQRLLGRAFHGAMQARNLAHYSALPEKEEIFIATLLRDIGELTFWCHAGRPADELLRHLDETSDSGQRDRMVREHLGTSFVQLSLALLKDWNLGEIGQLVQASHQASGPAARAVALGAKIAETAAQDWHSEQMQALVLECSKLMGVGVEEAMQQIVASTNEARQVAGTCSNGDLNAWIPRPDEQPLDLSDLLHVEEPDSRHVLASVQDPLLQPNLDLMKLSLQSLALMTKTPINIDSTLSAAMNGLHLGAGLERVMLAVLADKQTRFRVKRALGKGTQAWVQSFDLAVANEPHIFSYALQGREPLWIGSAACRTLEPLVTCAVRSWFGEGPFFIAPLIAGTRPVGILYADMRVSGRMLAKAQFDAFKRFAELTGASLQALSRR
ncbi:HDOD domain-containing protein [Pseudomonas sp.]|uniref:HDOD domain-containing protein n=1 Tax=Pseudomonas sp. TaxID=306 RepID=UPI00272AB47E|nr:HDOD domain-containing protein [Pseudomonas sp.]